MLYITFYQSIATQGARRHLAKGLLEEVSSALQLVAAVALHKLLQVGQPDVAHMRVLEHRHTLLVHLEGLLPELVLLQQPSYDISMSS